MLMLGIILIIGGVLSSAFGIAQNTILFNIFADEDARLERIWPDINIDDAGNISVQSDNGGWDIASLFDGPGTIWVIIGIIALFFGAALVITMIIRKRNRKKRSAG